ncbi:DUF1127 domain-containing protein [Amaricoccus solimangrovi]|uniref:DUF1127 domain-containing protein n=1 Tax=Amaricoccus solimangrovi TaxID=2589815 RepID=A0A501WT65_9RHOB|nr:DUF1127 domain-containing protein [Amaricoccus solimangrovi]TPE48986.1 DUF1127 domain-containing protein [Amaricoccus solimangrovi]
MTTRHHPRAPGTFLGRLAREARFRRDIARLEALDDHLLRDIGVARPGIRRAVRGQD